MKPSELELRMHRCCFTGHRPDRLNLPEKEIKKKLEIAVHEAIDEGFTTFISGMDRGVGIWAAQIVLRERAKNPAIKLIATVTFPDCEKQWREEWQQQYKFILEYADLVKYIADKYTGNEVFVKRNKWMVDHSGLIIAVYNGAEDGTKATIIYAEEQLIERKIIYDISLPDGNSLYCDSACSLADFLGSQAN